MSLNFLPKEIEDIILDNKKEMDRASVAEDVTTWYNTNINKLYNDKIKNMLEKKFVGYEKNEVLNELIKHGNVFFDFLTERHLNSTYDVDFSGNTMVDFSTFDEGIRLTIYYMDFFPGQYFGSKLQKIITEENLKNRKADSTAYTFQFSFDIFYTKGENTRSRNYFSGENRFHYDKI